MSISHNKKRNSCLIYEFLVQYITRNLIEGNEKSSNTALKILKQFYKPDTELYKEYRLLNALTTTTLSSEAVAASVLVEAKAAARSHDLNKLENEKTALIHSINRNLFDQDFYDQPVKEYKILATAQTLVNSWRQQTHADLAKVAQYEEMIFRNLTEQKTQPQVQKFNDESIGTNRLIFKTMLRKINEKYSGSLTQEQKSLLKAYAFSEAKGDDTINKKLLETKRTLTNLIDRHVTNDPNSYVSNKLLEVKQELENQDITPSDETLTKFMLYAKLKSELLTEEKK